MKLLISKTQRSSGMMNKSVVFQLVARVELNPDEQAALAKYKFGKEIVYSKENVTPAAMGDKSWGGVARNLAAAATNLVLTVDDLVQGKMIECKSIVEVLDVEQTIKTACEGLKAMLEACRTFEGETVLEY